MSTIKNKYIILLISICFSLLCSSYTYDTSIVSVKDSGDIPENKAAVYIYRLGRFSGIAINHKLFIDGTYTKSLGSGQYILLFIDPGIHSFYTETTMGRGGDSSIKDIDLESGEEYFIRISFFGNVGISHLKLMRPGLAKREISNCRLKK